MPVLTRLSEHGTFRSLRHPNYRRFYVGSLFSNTGTWIQRIGQDWLTLELTHSPTALGIVTGLQFAPALLFSLHGGSLADRTDKRRLLVVTNWVSLLAAAALGALVLTRFVTIWWVYALAFLLGTASAINSPVWQSFVQDLVGPDDLQNAIGLNSMSFNIGRLIGPALSGALIAAFDTGPSFLLNAASYLFVIASLSRLDPDRYFRGDTPHEHADRSVKAGLRYLRTQPDIVHIMVLIFFAGTFGLNFQMFMAVMARNVFDRQADEFGLLGSIMAVGSIAGSLMAARRQRAVTALSVNNVTLVFGISLAVSAFAPSYAWYAAVLPFCGFFALTMLTTANAFVQRRSDDAFRGRVMGVYLLLLLGGTPIGSPIVGWLAETYSARIALAASGASVISAAIATPLLRIAIRRLRDR